MNNFINIKIGKDNVLFDISVNEQKQVITFEMQTEPILSISTQM